MRSRPEDHPTPTARTDWRAARALQADASGYVERDGVRVFWESFGSGEPAVLILPTWSVLHAAHGRFQIADLARRYRVITFDGRGNGRSDRPAGGAAYADREFVADALAVLDATGTERAVTVACSLATSWLIRLAAEHPDRVLAAVSSGTNLPLAPDETASSGGVPFDEPYVSTDGWAKWNAVYWREHYEDFLRFFFGEVWNEPHSLSVIDDAVAWGLETTPDTLIDTSVSSGLDDEDETLDLVGRVACPVLVVHGGCDALTPVARSVRLAELTGGRLAILEGAGHCPGNRDPVKFDALIHEFIESTVGRVPRAARWSRAIDRRRRVLLVPDGRREDVVRRDLELVQALRAVEPDIDIVWLTPDPMIRAWLERRGETIHPASNSLLIEAPTDCPDCVDQHDLAEQRRAEEARFANFMVFRDLTAEEPFDVVVADSAWQIDHYLHQNPELKRFAFVWLTDRVFLAPSPAESEVEALLRADANAEMIELVARYPRLRDIALYLGDPRDLPPTTLGPGLPSARDWAARHFTFAGGDLANPTVAGDIARRIRDTF